MREEAFTKKKKSKKLILTASIILLSLALFVVGAVFFLERETFYTYEELSSLLEIHETEDGFWAEAPLYPDTSFAMSTETISMDEENQIQCVNLYIYLTTRAKNRYFEEITVSPFMALWDNGYEWAPISEHDFDQQGAMIKPEATVGEAKYRVVSKVYYAHFERNYDQLILHTEPVLLWSNETEKGMNHHD